MAEERKKITSPKNLAEAQEILEQGVALPAMVAADTETLRLQGTLSKPLPPIANVGSDPLVGYSTKARDAAQLAYETGLSYADTKMMNAKMKAISKAEEKQQEQFFRNKNRAFEKRLGKLSRYNTQGRNYYTQRFAGEMMGLGRDLYKVLR